MFWTLLVVLKSHELAFLCSLKASRETRKYKKPGSVLHQNLNLADAHAMCSLISVTKWRVYLPFPI